MDEKYATKEQFDRIVELHNQAIDKALIAIDKWDKAMTEGFLLKRENMYLDQENRELKKRIEDLLSGEE